MNAPRDATTILQDAVDTLQTAEWGLTDLTGKDPRRRIPGLRNVIVFGRAVTNVLQNLRSMIGSEFDKWYLPIRGEMEQDELLQYFYKLRSEILKEGSIGQVSPSMYIEQLNTAELQPLMQNPPKGARGFFLGDRIGGSGWEVELPDGTITKYYVALPDELKVKISLHFANPPTIHRGKQLADTSIEALAQHYVAYLRRLVGEAMERFGHEAPPSSSR